MAAGEKNFFCSLMKKDKIKESPLSICRKTHLSTRNNAREISSLKKWFY